MDLSMRISSVLSLFSLWRIPRRKRDAAAVKVTVYTRAQCGCCDKAAEVLKRFQRRYRLAIEEIDIDEDPALVALYNTSVPVIAVNGKVRFRGIINPVLLERLLSAESRGS
jgi:glutaredoxin